SLVSANAVAGSDNVSGHRVAYRRLTQTDNNANDWYVVAVNRKPVGSLLDGAGWAPLGMAAAALALLVLAGVSFRSSRRRIEEDAQARLAEERRTATERAHYEGQRELTEIMQVTRDESE